MKPEIDDYNAATSRVRALHAIVVGIIMLLLIVMVASAAAEVVAVELARLAG